jgi:hypothetical protein
VAHGLEAAGHGRVRIEAAGAAEGRGREQHLATLGRLALGELLVEVGDLALQGLQLGFERGDLGQLFGRGLCALGVDGVEFGEGRLAAGRLGGAQLTEFLQGKHQMLLLGWGPGVSREALRPGRPAGGNFSARSRKGQSKATAE